MSANTTAVQACLDRFRANEPGARDELIALTRDRLLSMVRGLIARFPGLRRWEQSEDVLHNVQVRMLRTLDQLPIETALDYFCIAARNMRWELSELHRRHFGKYGGGKYHDSPPVDAPDRGAVLKEIGDGPDPALLAELAELHDLVDGLPEDERQVFDLHWYHGLTQEEAADLIGVSEGTVKRRWNTAKVLLAARLDPGKPG